MLKGIYLKCWRVILLCIFIECTIPDISFMRSILINKFIMQRGESVMKSKRMLGIGLAATLIMASCFTGIDVGLLKLQKVYAGTQLSSIKAAVSIPTNVVVKATDKTLTVSWDAVTGAESYDISLNDDCKKVTGLKYTYENLQPDTKYTVKVRAVNPYISDSLIGDLNIDGGIDSIDFAMLRTYLLTDDFPITYKMLTDKNEDGEINSIDMALVKIDCLTLADVNGDDSVNAVDFAMIKKKLLEGDNYNFPRCESLWSKETIKYTEKTEAVENEFIQISSSRFHTAALKQDGTLWMWGDNNSGQLGDGTTNYSSTPVRAEISGVKQVVVTQSRTVALKEDGTVWSWGTNGHGQLGNGTKVTNSSIPVKADISGVKAVAAGEYYTLALKEDGTVWKWGYSDYYSLTIMDYEYGEITCSLKPVQFEISGVKALAAGEYYTLALKEDGTVWGWGNNSEGQLGSSAEKGINKTPLQIEGISDVKAVFAGDSHVGVIKEDGTVWTWGENFHGQLGNGTREDSSKPVEVEISGVKEIAVGGLHTIALKEDGTVWAWGNNAAGQFGNGTTQNSSIPVKADISEVKEINAGYIHSAALKKDGTVWAWGESRVVQINDMQSYKSNIPVQKIIED